MQPTSSLLARLSLEGLSVGDAFGEHCLCLSPAQRASAELPPAPWRWTDDTHMALSIVEILLTHERIAQDALASAFARRFKNDPFRGYARGTISILNLVAKGGDWRDATHAVFPGGSYGNGAAMRAAPIGGFFAGNPDRAAEEARLSALITHAHTEGQAGAIAVAVAASLAAARPQLRGQEFMRVAASFLPSGPTKQLIESAAKIPPDALPTAVRELGTGNNVSAQDTVPFCLWSAAHHLNDFEAALWWTAKGFGDCDTTCAIVGGIVALSSGSVPAHWLARREPLPDF